MPAQKRSDAPLDLNAALSGLGALAAVSVTYFYRRRSTMPTASPGSMLKLMSFNTHFFAVPRADSPAAISQ